MELVTGSSSSGRDSSREGSEYGIEKPAQSRNGPPDSTRYRAVDGIYKVAAGCVSPILNPPPPELLSQLPVETSKNSGCGNNALADHRLKKEVATLSEFIDMLSAEHDREYQRMQRLIYGVRKDITEEPRGTSGDETCNIIDHYLQSPKGRNLIVRKDLNTSEDYFESRSQTLRAGDLAIDIADLDREHREAGGAKIGHWYNVAERTEHAPV